MTWRCKLCGKVMSFSINKCPNCKRAKETGELMIRLRVDWICIKCGKNNFARRTVCFNTSCSSRNDEGNKSAGPSSSKQETLAAVCRTDTRKQDFRPWRRMMICLSSNQTALNLQQKMILSLRTLSMTLMYLIIESVQRVKGVCSKG